MIHNVPAIERRNQPYSHSWFHKTCYLKGELRTQLPSLFFVQRWRINLWLRNCINYERSARKREYCYIYCSNINVTNLMRPVYLLVRQRLLRQKGKYIKSAG